MIMNNDAILAYNIFHDIPSKDGKSIIQIKKEVFFHCNVSMLVI